MGFPSAKELKAVRAKLAKADPSRLLPPNATSAEKLKYKLCEKFVIYLMTEKITQSELAKRLKVNRSRVNEIVKYKLDLFTIDTLLSLAEKLDLDIEVRVS